LFQSRATLSPSTETHSTRASTHPSSPTTSPPRAGTPGLLDPSSKDPLEQSALRDWLQLQATLGLAPVLARECLLRAGNPREAVAISRRQRALDERALDAAVAVLRRRGYRALPLSSELYPAALFALEDPAPLLFVAGDVSHLSGNLVAIVGARAATVYGLEMARVLGERLALAGVTVVSGLARGIDAAAHRGALDASGVTLAVQACGPDRVYPAEHRRLAGEIAEGGALLTELPVGAPPRRPYFPLRNRLISGLCRGVIVIEARERSGSLITARHALIQGREVMALPGPVTSPTSWGPNRLIRDGAIPILELDDIFDGLGLPRPTSAEQAPDTPPHHVGPLGKSILESLDRGALTRDELGRAIRRDPQQLDLDLVDLELRGLVRRDRDGRMVRARAARRPGTVK
jgi:DNA processing protein